MTRFAAQLLFKFEVIGSPAKRKCICEERIVVIKARTARAAYREAMSKGQRSQHSYKNDSNQTVSLQFVGVLELLKLDPILSEDEVWFEIKELDMALLYAGRMIPTVDTLSAIVESINGK